MFDQTPEVVAIHSVAKKFVVRKDNSLKERIIANARGKKYRNDFWALRDVSASISAGTTIGLIGHNGSGKSTLLKIIGGVLEPSRGNVLARGKIAALLELGAGFHPDLTGRENVFLNATILGMSIAETEEKFDSILEFSEIGEFIDTQVKFYSSGMYVRLAFAVAIHTDPDVLLVDEVLAVGDEAFQRKCMDSIRRFQNDGGTIVLVSHNLNQVTELCDRVLLLNDGVVDFDGDPQLGVARFRELLERRRQRNLPANDGVELHPWSSDVQLRGGSIRAEESSSQFHLYPGDDLEIHVVLRSSARLTRWQCGIQIENSMGQAVYTTSSDYLGYPLSRFDGSASVIFTLSNTSFGEGRYFINVSVLDDTGQHLFDDAQAATFYATTPRHSIGAVYAATICKKKQGGDEGFADELVR